jgi:ketosteroid isomerase-like protein
MLPMRPCSREADDRGMTTTQTRTPLETVQALYAAFGAGDMDGLLALVDPDVDWSVGIEAPGAELVPMLRDGRGPAAVLHYFSGVAQMDISTFELRQALAEGDTVLTVMHIAFTHRTTGKSLAMDEVHHFTVSGDGLVTRYRPFVDTASLIEAFRP